MKKLFLFMCLLSLIGCTKEVIQLEKTINCTITLTNNDTIYNNVLSTVTANITTSNTEVSKVEYFVDGVSKKTLFSKPYNLDLTLSDLKTGTHTITLNVMTTDDTSKSFNKDFFFKVNLGDTYQGGIVVHIFDNQLHGIIASKEDLTDGVLSKYKYGFYNGDYQSYSTTDGLSNTLKFTGKYDSNYAAIACLNLNKNGLDDWYLPAIAEFDYIAKYESVLIQNRLNNIYWTSTLRSDNTHAEIYGFGRFAVTINDLDVQVYHYVKPCRRF